MSNDTTQTRWGGYEPNSSHSAANDADDLSGLPVRTRRQLGETFGGDRDLYQTLGYDESPEIEDYWDKYLRQDIARKIVDAPAETTWREQPEVTDDDDDDAQTAFEGDVETLFREHELQARLDAIDRLSGIGHFGVLVIGFADGEELSEPVNTGALNGPDDLAYLMPIAEDRVEDWDLVTDSQDERFQLPETYRIDFSQRERLNDTFVQIGRDERTVHHERVIHVPAGNTLDNMLMARPRLEAVYNRLDDIEKVVGASAEAMWRAADYGLAIQSDPEHAGKLPKERKEEIEAELQKWFHGLQPFLRLSGFDVEKLDGNPTDPSGIFDALIKLVAGEAGIPQRILTGSERGELASSQDRASWLGRISERQTNFAEPKIFRPLLDRLLEFGLLSDPQGDVGDDAAGEGEGRDYEVEWPDLFELSDSERADISAQLAQALSNARDPQSAEPVMSPGEIRQEVFGLDPELGAEVDIEEDLPDPDDDPMADLLPDGTELPGEQPGDGDDEEEGDGDGPPDSDEGDAPSESDAPDDAQVRAVQAQFESSHVHQPVADGGEDTG